LTASSHRFVEALRRAYAAPFGHEESFFAVLEAFAAPEFQVHDRTLPEAAAELRGVAAMRAEVAQMKEAFEDIHYGGPRRRGILGSVEISPR
jgi:hypothetical protein